jgi:subtilisin-like proprotein convertase family protein/Zn-dependent metalloprotease
VRAITIAVTSLAVVLGTSVGAVAGSDDEALPSYDVRTAGPAKAGSGTTTGFVGRTDGYLTGPSGRSAEEVARAFLRGGSQSLGLERDDVASLAVTDAYTSGLGVQHLTFDQLVDGVPVWGGQVMANVDAKGRLINVSGNPVPGLSLDTTTADLTRLQALHRARADVGGETSGGFADIESASLVAFPLKDSAELAWEVWVDSPDGILYESVVSASTGEVLSRTSRTAFDSAYVYDNHPRSDRTAQTVNLAADPSWLSDTAGRTRLAGNNAHAYADTNGTNGVQAGEDVPSSDGTNWLYPVSFFADAGCPAWGCTWRTGDKVTNQNAQTTGLFYLVNRFHDYLLSAPIGFDEASRNFEQVNSTGQGLGNDRVLAEANDFSGTNNANMSTPPDGSSPRMQQYFFDINNNRVSSSDSADVVFHEYTHGLSNRLVGNASGLGAQQSGAMGEAWSDWYANDFLVATGEKTDGPGIDLRLGEYAVGPAGIRNQPMDCNPDSAAASCPANGTSGTGGFTFGDLGSFNVNGVHDNGEIWSQTLWDLREKVGVTNARALVTDGLRLTPANPTFLQARDAILQAALVRGIPQQSVWQVFAARGMGYSATTPGANVFSATEAFDLPVGLRHVSTTVTDLGGVLGDADGVAEPGETLQVVTRLRSQDAGAVTGVSGSTTATEPSVVIDPATTTWPDFATTGTEADSAPVRVTIPATVPCGASFDLTRAVTSSAGAVTVPAQRVAVGRPVFTLASPNVAVPDNNATGVTATITLPAGTVDGLEVKIAQLTHTYVGDLRITLTSPAGTTVTLADRPGAGTFGSSADNFTDLVLADDAPANIDTIGNAGPITGRWAPAQPLAAFDGQPSAGTWTLRVSDVEAGDTGTLQQWGLLSGFDCATSAAAAPVATTGAARDIGGSTATLAGSVDPTGTATEVAFEVGTTTAYGRRTAPVAAGAGTGASAQAAAVDGLVPGTTYHFRVLALRGGTVVTRGADRTFTTLTQSCVDSRAAVVAAQDALRRADATLVTATQQLAAAVSVETTAATDVAAAKAKVAKARKALAKAKKALRKAKASGSAADVAKALTKVKRAKKALKKALAQLRAAQGRLTTAQAATAAARTALDQATQARAAAAAALVGAEQAAATQCGSPG